MPTQEERLSTLEQTVTVLGNGIQDLNHNVTILLGVTSEQGKDIRGIKVNLAALNERVDAFEQNVNGRFETLEQNVNGRFETLEQNVDSRFETLEQNVNSRFEALEQNVNGRFEALDGRVSGLDGRIGALEYSVNSRFEEQGKKLDQVLLLLNSVIPKPEQGT
jgi:chromosome segregation ATPase